MNIYYLMNTSEKDAVDPSVIHQEPLSNIAGDLWILECTQSGLNCTTEYANVEECRNYVNDNVEDWDEFYNV